MSNDVVIETIRVDIKGIKCDNVSCDYEDMEIDFDADKFLNAPCPKCGESLLTQEDYNAVKSMLAVTDAVSNVFIGVDFGENPLTTAFEVIMDGSGSVKLDKSRVVGKDETTTPKRSDT